ncbi:hypothetical protein BaRGS_00030133 [Batillaria attramentaria]|uniref:Uncharacterized protein n=1 Tax=Batillaria attramentaria TaxID=370345 RepID=A0ABD0JV71_9CAEN
MNEFSAGEKNAVGNQWKLCPGLNPCQYPQAPVSWPINATGHAHYEMLQLLPEQGKVLGPQVWVLAIVLATGQSRCYCDASHSGDLTHTHSPCFLCSRGKTLGDCDLAVRQT